MKASDLIKNVYSKRKLKSGKVVDIKPWTMEEELNILYAVEDFEANQDYMILLDNIIDLLQNQVKDIEVKNLSKFEVHDLITVLRKISKGSEVTVPYKCSNTECPTFIKYSPEKAEETGEEGIWNDEYNKAVKVEEAIVKNVKFMPELTIGDFKFIMKELSFGEEFDLEKDIITEESKITDIKKYGLKRFEASIDKILYEDEELELDVDVLEFLNSSNFKIDELDSMIDDFNNNQNEVYYEYDLICPICKSKRTEKIDNLLTILLF